MDICLLLFRNDLPQSGTGFLHQENHLSKIGNFIPEIGNHFPKIGNFISEMENYLSEIKNGSFLLKTFIFYPKNEIFHTKQRENHQDVFNFIVFLTKKLITDFIGNIILP